jgi:hypothetical protein
MFSRLLVASVLLLGLEGFGADAHADSKGDWGQFIEKPGDHVVNKPASASQPVAVKAVKAPRPDKAAKATKKAKPKQAAKRPAARKH